MTRQSLTVDACSTAQQTQRGSTHFAFLEAKAMSLICATIQFVSAGRSSSVWLWAGPACTHSLNTELTSAHPEALPVPASLEELSALLPEVPLHVPYRGLRSVQVQDGR
jgi:hypothetical protein